MLKAILFDLDNTLIDFNEDNPSKRYHFQPKNNPKIGSFIAQRCCRLKYLYGGLLL